MTDRKTLDQMTSDDLDALYEQLECAQHTAASSQQHAHLTTRDLKHADAERASLRVRLASALGSMKLLRLYASQLDHDGQVDAADVAARIRRLAAGLDKPAPAPASGPAGLREQYAAAIEADAEQPPDERVGILNAVLAVRDRRMEQLAAGRATWKAKAEEIEADRDRHAAALREVLDALVRNGGVPPTEADVDRWRAALEPTKEQP